MKRTTEKNKFWHVAYSGVRTQNMQDLTKIRSIQNTHLASEAGTDTSVIQYYKHPLVITRRAIKFYPKQMLTLAGSQICTGLVTKYRLSSSLYTYNLYRTPILRSDIW